MKVWIKSLILLSAVLTLGGCGGGGGSGNKDNSEALAYVNMALDNTWEYDVWTTGTILDGKVTVVAIDTEFVDGIDAFKVEINENQFLVATRWYQVTWEGLFLLGEEVVEGSSKTLRTFSEPILVVPYPLEDEFGDYQQTWSTESNLAEGGQEKHRYDNMGRETLDVPAGPFEAFHFVLTRTDNAQQSQLYNEYFLPGNGFVQFEYPAGDTWKLR